MPVSLKAITPRAYRIVDTNKLKFQSRNSMRRYLEEVSEKMQEYPPKKERRVGNQYERTYILADGWAASDAIEINENGTEGTLVNRVPYAVYAQGPVGGGRPKGQRQAQFMRNLKWKSITDVARETRRKYVDVMNRVYSGSPG